MTLGVFTAGAGWSHDGGSLGQWLSQVGQDAARPGAGRAGRGADVPRAAARRGVARLWAAAAPILLLSVLFALAHIEQSGRHRGRRSATSRWPGIFLVARVLQPGGMWTAFGAHLGWNATLAALAAPVSGLPFDIPYIDYRTGGPAGSPAARSGPRAACSRPSR